MFWNRVRTGLLVVAVCWVVLFWRLGHVGLMDDEAHYARLTQEMAAERDWMVPRLGGVANIDKPVFFHWVQGVTTALVPDGELSARMPSALAAVALFGILGWFGIILCGPRSGWWAWLMLATMPATFLLGRTGYMDMLFTALLFGAVALISRAQMNGGGWAHVGAVICLALAILTKGPVAAGLVGAWLAALWLIGGAPRRAVARLRLWWALLGVCALALPWFLWMYWQYGDLFLTGYLGPGHAGYLTPRASASSSDWAFYARMFMTSFFPWSLIMVGYGIDTWRRRRQGAETPVWETGLWLWIAIVLVAFTLVPFRVDRYIYPAAPACCLLAARGWLAASAEARWREYAATRIAMGAVALIFVGSGVFIWWSLPRLALPLPDAIAVLPAGLVTGGVAILAVMMRRGAVLTRLPAWPIAALLIAYASIVVIGFPILRTGLPIEQVGRFVAEHTRNGDPVGVLGLDRWQMGLSYYLHTPPERLRTAEEAKRFVSGPGPRWVVMRGEWHEAAAPGGCVRLSLPAIVGTTGRGIRTQVWGDIVVVRYDASTTGAHSACTGP